MSENQPRAFAALLRRHRLDAGLTQEALAERAGLSTRGIGDLERGINRSPYVATILRLGDALELSEEQRAELEASVSRRRRPASSRPVMCLPVQLTSMLGRDAEVAAAIHLLRWEGRRLLTLTGPGGVGKTRLAIEVAAAIAPDFDDGAIFVPLEEVVDADAVRPAIAAAIHLQEEPDTPLHESLVQYLKDRELLLVLDGFEHLMEASSVPSQLLVACTRLKVLVTSRAPLHLRGEQELDVDPLPVPDLDGPVDLDILKACPSVTLFVQRTRQVKPGFELTLETAPLVAEICRRLDGLPLAIELAAARVKQLSPHALLRRLEPALSVLTGGPHDAQPRQQTMRATIAWSYDLLGEEARALFRSLSVFNAPFGLEASTAVCREEQGRHGRAARRARSVGGRQSLEGGPDRHRRTVLLDARNGESVRHRAVGGPGEGDEVRLRLADYCVTLAETAEAELHRANQALWMARLERDDTRFSSFFAGRASRGTVTGLRIAGAFGASWYSHGYLSEGRASTEALLTAEHDSDCLPDTVHAKACGALPCWRPCRATTRERKRSARRGCTSIGGLAT